MPFRVLSIKIAGSDPSVLSCYNKALEWVRKNTIPEQGVVITSKQRSSYPEVTGYMISTLYDAGENVLAEQYARYLSDTQRPNGSFVGPDRREYVFDSGQALRGLVRAYQHDKKYGTPALKAAEFIASHIEEDGRIQSPNEKTWIGIPEHIHVFALPPLVQAGTIFGKSEYLDKAERSMAFYKKSSDILDDHYLTHFVAYTIDGFVDMGESEFIYPLVKNVFSRQKRNGSIPAYPNVRWTCSTGLAQLAIIAHKLHMYQEAEKAIDHLCKLQNPSGGFYGSYGLGAKYFPKEEISWANKFFLDAIHLRAQRLKTYE